MASLSNVVEIRRSTSPAPPMIIRSTLMPPGSGTVGVSRLLPTGPSDVIYDMKSSLPNPIAVAASSARPLSRAPPPPMGNLTDNTPIPPVRQSKVIGDGNDVVYSTSAASLDVKAWDVFRLLPPKSDLRAAKFWLDMSLQLLKLVTFPVVFCLLMFSAVLSKSSLLFMTSAVGWGGKNASLCGNLRSIGYYTNNTVVIENRHVVKYVWATYMTLCAPELFCFIRCVQRVWFRTVKKPTLGQFFAAFALETLHAIGTGLLVFKVLVGLDAVTGAMLTNCVCFIPSVLTLLSRKPSKITAILVLIDLGCIAAQSSGFWAWPIFVPELSHHAWAVPMAIFLCSLGWWENFVSKDSIFPCIQALAGLSENLKQVRSKTYIILAPWKCMVYFCCLFTFISMRMSVQELLEPNPFDAKEIKVVIRKGQGQLNPELFEPPFDGSPNNYGPITTPSPEVIDIAELLQTNESRRAKRDAFHRRDDVVVKYFYTTPYDAVWVSMIAACAGFFCYQCAKFACKICIQRLAFALPLNFCVPVIVFVLNAMCLHRLQDSCYFTNVLPYELFWKCPSIVSVHDLITRPQTWFWLLWLLAQIWVTIHIWMPKCERLADTDRLFVVPWYSAAFIDQSLSLNRRRDDLVKIKTEEIELDTEDGASSGVYETIPGALSSINPPSVCSESQKSISGLNSKTTDNITRIYACATMWHETREEMLCMLKSIFRLDEDQCARRNAQKYLKIVDPDYYDFEGYFLKELLMKTVPISAHIMFDDSFETNEYGEPVVNHFVKQLLEVIDVAAGAVHQITMRVKPPKKYITPYGGRLVWTLPGRNRLTVHLKDKNKIRPRKRWSQVMYMYYLLGHRLMEKIDDVKRKETIAENTYILTLDGDVDFQPASVHLLVDLMKKNRRLGAACGRIHPRGSGPMVWYQKFEYAIGHWFQKATEHMIGCVLCSPGCFSLFRSAALMDDNVLRRYATRAEKAKDYIQYDQGEDRWLCTLLLQRGYRVEYSAASDALTFAPQSFNEFFNQRRRWIPSTIANVVDLLADHRNVVKLNDSISVWYILYQFAMLLSSILGPGTIFLMVAGAVNISFTTNTYASFIFVLAPVLIFLVVCFTCKPETQLMVAQIISAWFAMLMMAVIVGTALQIKKDGISSPHAIFLLWVIGSFFSAALLHPLEFTCIIPGILYFLMIPCTYMLLTIYSVCNLHVVSWGTREHKTSESEEKKRGTRSIRILEDGKDVESQGGDMDGVYSVGCGNTCRILCCLQPSAIGNSPQMAKITEKIENLDKKVDRIDRRFALRRASSLALSDGRAEPVPEEDEEPVDDNFDLPYHHMQKEKAAHSEAWLNDRSMRHAERDTLDVEEEKFWKDLVDRYLYPIRKDKNKEQIETDLRSLRNQVSFAFFMCNALFILVVFLLQLKKDCLNVEWPIGEKQNRTVVPCDSDGSTEEVWVVTGLQLEPIGFVFLIFFMSLLVIQFVAMLLHRFGTLSHILASTQLFCFRKTLDRLSEDELVAEHFVEIAKELQAIRGIDEDSNDGGSVADEAEMTISRRRVVKSLEHSRRSMMKKRTETLDAAFKKRFFALSSERSVGGERDAGGDIVTPVVGGRSGRRRLTMRRGTIRALEQRRNSVFGTLDHSTENPYSDEAANGAPRGPSRRRIDRLFHHKNGEPRADGDEFQSDSDDDLKISAPAKSGNGGSSKLNYQDSWIESDAAAVKRSGAMATSAAAPRSGRLPSVEQQLISGKQGGEESSHF